MSTPATARARCTEWARGARLHSFHTWEYETGAGGRASDGTPVVCTACGTEYAEFEARVERHFDLYMEAYVYGEYPGEPPAEAEGEAEGEAEVEEGGGE